ncbi:hypothetical protein E5D57_001775 [Metarhizium anisopliae]|nr:hypothetical protein E5D57_001735 [Metarhizium anisopliae]KAF5137975.1 hypothetical protein E5D57_001754 [Metarhizium anisopliae]KAF5137996.1 hypothetical protein E5D57_001775 [Metarhizium anisopliae]
MAIYTPGPFRLVTVNNAPERAKYVIGRVIDGLKDRYEIEYVGNCDGIDKMGINNFDSVALVRGDIVLMRVQAPMKSRPKS